MVTLCLIVWLVLLLLVSLTVSVTDGFPKRASDFRPPAFTCLHPCGAGWHVAPSVSKIFQPARFRRAGATAKPAMSAANAPRQMRSAFFGGIAPRSSRAASPSHRA
jgi:hypothetical protein